MASSAAVVSSPQPKPSCLAIDDEDEEIEYEEIEEEIEVEEEVEIEEEIEEGGEVDDVGGGGEDKIGGDLTPARRGIQENRKNRDTDTNQIMELEEHKDRIQSGYISHGNNVLDPLMDVPSIFKTVGDVKPSKSSEKEELHIVGERASRDNSPKAPINDSGTLSHVKTTAFIRDVNASSVMPGASSQKDNAIFSVTAENNHTAVEVVGNTRQIFPRLHLPHIRARDPLSSAELGGDKKKLRIVCEFHAKGWCIRGNTCRFLHIKDGLDAVAGKSEVLERKASSSECIPPQQSWENPKRNIESLKLVPQKDDTFGSAHLQDDRGSFGSNLHLDRYSHYAAPFIKDSLSFGSSSWNTNTRRTQNFWESGLEHRASVSSSLQRSIPPVSHSKSDSLSLNHNFRDTRPANYESIFSSFDWEPSVPFCPSHEITRKLLKESLYDPMRDGIGKKDVGDGRLKFSHSDQGSSVKDVNVQSNSLPEEEKLFNSAHAGDTMKDNVLSSSCGDKLKFDKERDKPVLEVSGSANTDKTEVDFKEDCHIQGESKALKIFQSALIDFVKELVRPTWQKGLLSKDAHKVIVKKSVDKIISSLEPHQIPSTGESVKLYLSTFQPKIAKLVEAYLDKYGKS